MRHYLGVRLRVKAGSIPLQLGSQLAEILNDPVMNDRDILRRMRMSIAFGRLSMSRPAGVTDASMPRRRTIAQLLLKVPQLTFGAAALDLDSFESCEARGIVATIFQSPERRDQLINDRTTAQNANNSTHINPCSPASRSLTFLQQEHRRKLRLPKGNRFRFGIFSGRLYHRRILWPHLDLPAIIASPS
ncbi:hypothetical protein ABIF44_006915 [Bradyrhizobium japonicum]